MTKWLSETIDLKTHEFASLDGRRFSNDACAAWSDFMAGHISGRELRERVLASLLNAGAKASKRQLAELDELAA